MRIQATRRAGSNTTIATKTELGGVALLSVGSAAATVYWSRSMAASMPMPGGWTLSMVWMRMPGQPPGTLLAAFLAMWIVMMVAMMLPPLVPMLAALVVGGMMRLSVVVAVAAAISLERLGPRPDLIVRGVGVVAIVIGVVTIGWGVSSG